MCVTLAAAALIATVASTAVTTYGAIQQGNAAKAQADYQSQINKNNATVANQQAADALRIGKQQEDQQRLKVREMVGQQRAGEAASGFSLGDQTSQSILGDTAMLGEMDAQTIKLNAQKQAWGYKVQANNYTASSNMDLMAGSNAKQASYLNAAGDLFSGASKFGTQYTTFKKNGAF